MISLGEILTYHAQKYPLMQPQDAVKLVFQNEFGGGHMVFDRSRCFDRLLQEFRSTEKLENISTTEPIGNGIVRVNLACTEFTEAHLNVLNEVFIASANDIKGSYDSFKEKLNTLYALCADNVFSFSVGELKTYLCEYEKQGYGAVSHSEIYRREYKPAYRIVLASKYM